MATQRVVYVQQSPPQGNVVYVQSPPQGDMETGTQQQRVIVVSSPQEPPRTVVHQSIGGGITVTHQPAGPRVYTIMTAPDPIPGVPTGLEYLTQIEQLICKQKVTLRDILVEYQTYHKYRVLNSKGQQVYFAFREPSAGRGFFVHVTDNFHREVLRLERNYKWCTCFTCCAGPQGCCAYPVSVSDGEGSPLGEVHVEKQCCKPHYGLYDAARVKLYDTRGPCCATCKGNCSDDLKFPLVDVSSGDPVATISKVWGHQDWFADSDNFGISFPLDLDAKHKALMMAAMFLVSYEWYERD